jgi:hypothetical protein
MTLDWEFLARPVAHPTPIPAEPAVNNWWLNVDRHLTPEECERLTPEMRKQRRSRQAMASVRRSRAKAKAQAPTPTVIVDAETDDWTQPVAAALEVSRVDLDPKNNPLAERYRRRLEGLRRFVTAGWHEKALAAGWSIDALYGAAGAVWMLELDAVLNVTPDLIMAKDRTGMSLPIYKGAWE